MTDRTQDERFCSPHIRARSVIHLQAENEALIADRDAMAAALRHNRELLVAYGPRYIAKAIRLADEALTKHGERLK